VNAEARIVEALALIGSLPGYEDVAAHLEDLRAKGKIRVEEIADRGTASVWGVITLGPEALTGGAVGLAETLVHERFHLTQAPLAKTASFWGGVFTGTPVWRRLERPAYNAAVEFLDALAVARPELSDECSSEAESVRAAFLAHYGEPL
jgi:hypothetical protein